VLLDLLQGRNRLVGVQEFSQFEDVSVVGFTNCPVTFDNPYGDGCAQVLPAPLESPPLTRNVLPDYADWRQEMPVMTPRDIMPAGNAQDLVIYARRQHHVDPVWPALRGIGAAGPGLTLQPAPPGQASRYVLDLGRPCCGALSIDVDAGADSVLMFSFLAAVDETVPRQFDWARSSNNALVYRPVAGFQRFESHQAYAGRYVTVLHTGERPLHLHRLQLLSSDCGVLTRGYFSCSDAALESIYADAVQLLRCSTDDTFNGNPVDEQACWAVDARLLAQADLVCNWSLDVCRHSLLLFAEDPEYQGLSRCHAPGSWQMQIPLWSFHWIMWCADYYRATADQAFLARILPTVRRAIAEALSRTDGSGLLCWPDAWHFVEWSSERDDMHAVNTAEQAGLCGALGAALELATAAGCDEDDLVEWSVARVLLVEAVNFQLWDEESGAYVDSMHADGTLSTFFTRVTNAMCCLYGVATPPRRATILRKLRRPASANLLPTSSVYGLYYILELFDAESDVRTLFQILRRRWCGTPESEFESLTPAAALAREPVAAFVVKYLIRYALGVRWLAPGRTSFQVDPRLPDLDFCNGAVPTANGLVRIHWERRGSRINIDVEHPGTITRVSSQHSAADGATAAD
jgi:hypothetical protein